jgi:hypothetical protein
MPIDNRTYILADGVFAMTIVSGKDNQPTTR